jgi:magnesium transporter
MIRVLHFNEQGQLQDQPEPSAIQQYLDTEVEILWVDIQAEEHQVCEPLLRQTFHFDALAVDDALRETHVPKVDDWERYLYIVLHDISYARSAGEIEITELDIFLGKNFLVTYHEFPIAGLETAWTSCIKDERHVRLGADHFLYRVADEIVNDFLHAVDAIDEDLEDIQDSIFKNSGTQILQKIFAMKRSTLHLRRSLSPLREVFNKLARDDFFQIDVRDQMYFRDIYDHLVRLHDISESLRDLAGGVLDTYLSVVNNRMNEIMKTLTIITSFFMPISFVAGFFGMNFFLPDHPITSFMSVPVFISVMVILSLTPIGMLLWMRRRGWL